MHGLNQARRLRRLLRPFILRRTKSQVLEELPPKTEITLRVEPTEAQLALYEGLRRAALERAQRAASNPQERMRLLAELMKLRRAACHPRLVLGDEATDEQGEQLQIALPRHPATHKPQPLQSASLISATIRPRLSTRLGAP